MTEFVKELVTLTKEAKQKAEAAEYFGIIESCKWAARTGLSYITRKSLKDSTKERLIKDGLNVTYNPLEETHYIKWPEE